VTVTESQDGIRTKGHILFYFPIITKSAKITFMPVAEEMAKRGHQVILVELCGSFIKSTIEFEHGHL
jgi:hypothetical protein